MNIKKNIAIALSFMLVLSLVFPCLMVASAEGEFADGDGTPENPYKIATKAQLDNVRNHLNSHFILENDIVFEKADFEEGGAFYNDGQGFKPIGHWTEKHDWNDGNIFSGSFNGNGFAISGLYQNLKFPSGGLFGRVDGAKIYDLTIKNSSFITESRYSKVAALVGWAYRVKIKNCRIENNVTVKAIGTTDSDSSAMAGGVLGYFCSESIIQMCVNKASVSAEHAAEIYAGGLVGNGAGEIIIENSCNEGTVIASSSGKGDKIYAGGLIGNFIIRYHMRIRDSYNAGEVKAEGEEVGSIVALGGVAGCADGAYRPSFMSVHNAGLLQHGAGESISVNPMVAIFDFKDSEWNGPIESTVFKSCYYLDSCTDKEVKAAKNVTALSGDEFKNQASFEGWEFEELWKINGEYPTLLLLDVITKAGDVTLDNKLNSRDLATMQKIIFLTPGEPELDGYMPTTAQAALSDINYDGYFNSRDIAYLQRILMK